MEPRGPAGRAGTKCHTPVTMSTVNGAPPSSTNPRSSTATVLMLETFKKGEYGSMEVGLMLC